MKKITILSLHLGVGGIEKYIRSLSKILENDYEIELIITYKLKEKPSFQFSDKVSISYLIDGGPNREEIRRAFRRKKFFKLVKEMFHAVRILSLKRIRTKRALKNLETDYLITTRTYETKLANKILKDKDIRKIATDHNFPSKKYKKELIKSTTNYDKLVVVNNEILDIYKKEIGDKVICIPNFLDEISKEKSKLCDKNIVAVGRFSKEKGFIDLVEIMSLIVKVDNRVKLTLIGDGPQSECIKSKIKELGLESNVKLTGYLNEREVQNVMLNSSVYAMTSFTESFGLVIAEAMNSGLPVVAFDSASGARDLLSNDTGVLVSNRDKEKFAQEILNLLGDSDRLKFYADKSLERVKSFSAGFAKKEWLKLLDDIKDRSVKKVMFISSTGGHLNELLMLSSMFKKYGYVLVTEKTPTTKGLRLEHGRSNVKYLVYGTRKHFVTYPFKLFINTIKSFYFYFKFRPGYIVSTGAHTAGPMCLIGHIFKSKIIFIETFANSVTPSVTGKAVYKFADLFVVQWEDMIKVYDKATFGGWIY